MSWDQIAADPALAAKLYSGYMGPGGDWAQGATLTPGTHRAGPNATGRVSPGARAPGN